MAAFLPSFFRVLFLVLFSSSSFAATSPQKDSIITKNTAEIYVTENIIIVGNNDFSNTNIISIKTVERKSSKCMQVTIAKSEDLSISAQINKKEKIANLQKLFKENATIFITQIPASSDFNNTTSQQCKDAVESSNSKSVFKFLKAIPLLATTQNCKDEKNKQKFYTSLSFLKFGKYRSSSLRAPPIFS